MGIGVLSTIAYALLYLALAPLLGARRRQRRRAGDHRGRQHRGQPPLTFGVRGREDLARHHVRGALVFVLTLALTNGALAVLHGLDPDPARALELGVLVAATLTATVTRYVAHAHVGVRPRRRAIRPSLDLVSR